MARGRPVCYSEAVTEAGSKAIGAPKPPRATNGSRRGLSQQQLAREVAGARALQDISTRLITETTQQTLFPQILDAAMELMAADAAGLQMLSADGRSLILLAWRNFHPSSVNYWRHVRTDSGCACATAFRGQQRVVVGDVEAFDLLRNTQDILEYRRSGVRAAQITPLESRTGQPLGMISTHWREPHTPTEGDFRLFDVLARQAADLIERTRAEEATRISEAKYRSLFESMGEAFHLIEIIRDEDDQPVDMLYVDENAAGARLAGMSVKGQRLSALNAGALAWWLPVIDRVMQTGHAERFEKRAALNILADGWTVTYSRPAKIASAFFQPISPPRNSPRKRLPQSSSDYPRRRRRSARA